MRKIVVVNLINLSIASVVLFATLIWILGGGEVNDWRYILIALIFVLISIVGSSIRVLSKPPIVDQMVNRFRNSFKNYSCPVCQGLLEDDVQDEEGEKYRILRCVNCNQIFYPETVGL